MAQKRGQIRRRGKDRYQIRIYLGRDASGKRKWHTETVLGTRRNAERTLTAKLQKLDMGKLTEVTRETVEGYLRRWLETAASQSVRSQTHSSYKQLLEKYVIPALGTRRLAQLSPLEVQELINDLNKRGLGSRTVRYIIGVFRQALQQAVRWRLLPSNPAETGNLTLPRQTRTEQRWLSADEVRKLLEAAADNRLSALWHVAVMTGLRPGEYRALTWEDVDLEAALLRVRRTLSTDGKNFSEPKTKRSARTVTLPPSTVQVLRNHKRRQAEERLKAGRDYDDRGLVFCTASGRPIEHNNLVHYHFHPLLKKAALPRIRLYDLRHTNASLLLEVGENLKVVSERLGHSTITLTADVYAHVSQGMQAKAAERLEKSISGKQGRVGQRTQT